LPIRQSQRVTLCGLAVVAGIVFHPEPPHWGHVSVETSM
jgi:hypothetical protein